MGSLPLVDCSCKILTSGVKPRPAPLQSPHPMKRSNELKEAHQLNAKRLLDLGFRKADVASTLQRKYHLSRATAYRDVDEADQSRELEDLTIEAEPVPMISMEDRDALMRMTRQMLIDAYEDGNVQDYARLVREYERLARMGGLSQKF